MPAIMDETSIGCCSMLVSAKVSLSLGQETTSRIQIKKESSEEGDLFPGVTRWKRNWEFHP